MQITSTSVFTVPQDPLFGNPFAPQQEQQQSLGSGFVIDKTGHIVTNYHVVQGAKSVQVSFSNGENVKASVIGTDPSTDIAVLQVHAHSRALTPLAWGDSDALKVGDSVVAIGNPFGYSRSRDGRDRERRRPAADRTEQLHDRPRDPDGRRTESRQLRRPAARRARRRDRRQLPDLDREHRSAGQPRHRVRDPEQCGAQRRRAAHPERPRRARRTSGSACQELSPSIAQLFRLPVEHGLLVAQVEPGSGAAKAGLRGPTNQAMVAGVSWALGGDIIVRGRRHSDAELNRLSDVLANHKPGDTIKLVVYRGTASKKTIEVKLGRQPSSP